MELGIIDLADILTIFALIAGPVIAVRWSQKMAGDVRRENNLRDEKAEKKNQHMAIFKNLMANRNHSAQQILQRTEAINLVPIVFYESTAIRTNWINYIESVQPTAPRAISGDFDYSTAEEKYQNLLKSIATHLEYHFTDDDLDRGYNVGWSERIFDDEDKIRKGLANLFSKDGNLLPIALKEPSFGALSSLKDTGSK